MEVLWGIVGNIALYVYFLLKIVIHPLGETNQNKMKNKLLLTRMVPIPRQMFLPYYLTAISSYWKEHTHHVSVAPTRLGSEIMLVFLLWKEMHG